MIGSRRIRLEIVDSTNTYAKQLLRELPEEGTIVTAEMQTAGRGRLDRQWLSAPSQNVLATIILYPRREPEEWGGLPLLSGLAVARCVRKVAGVETHLKWPNDVLVGSRKLSGILVESGRQGERSWAIAGIGININQVDFDGSYRLPPTSLALEAGRPFDPDMVLAELCNELDALYTSWSEQGNAPVIAAWIEASSMLGKPVVVDEGVRRRSGRAVDIGMDGSLKVDFGADGIEHVFAGDVSLGEEDSR